jgi:FkbM family methyltransferase
MGIRRMRKKMVKFFLNYIQNRISKGLLRPVKITSEGYWFETGLGFHVFSDLHDKILKLETNALWEKQETEFVLKNIDQGTVFIDVGANIGYFSLAVASKAKRVIAIEPIPKTFNVLKKNVEFNGFGSQVHLLNIALGKEEGFLEFTDNLGPKNHVLSDSRVAADDRVSRCIVKATTLDNVVEELQLPGIDFIKVDVEGFEYAFLQGAKAALQKFQPILLMEIEKYRCTNYSIDPTEIFSILESLGYKYLVFTEDAIVEPTNLTDDLAKGRDFAFYKDHHSLKL